MTFLVALRTNEAAAGFPNCFGYAESDQQGDPRRDPGMTWIIPHTRSCQGLSLFCYCAMRKYSTCNLILYHDLAQ